MGLLDRDKTDTLDDTRSVDERSNDDAAVSGRATADDSTMVDHRVVGRDDRGYSDRGYSDRPSDRPSERAVVAEGERDEAEARDREVVVAKPHTMGLIIRTVIFTLAVAALVAVATQNRDDVSLDMVFEQYESPLWVVIVLSAAVGCIVGLMVRARRQDTLER